MCQWILQRYNYLIQCRPVKDQVSLNQTETYQNRSNKGRGSKITPSAQWTEPYCCCSVRGRSFRRSRPVFRSSQTWWKRWPDYDEGTWATLQALLLFLILYLSSTSLPVMDENQIHVHTNFVSVLWQKRFELDHPHFPQTIQECFHVVSTKILVHGICKIDFSVSVRSRWFSFFNYFLFRMCNLQCLWWFSAILATFGWTIRSSIIARVCATSIWRGICWPVPPNALSVHPSLAFSHPREVNCNWITAGWSGEVRLMQNVQH